MGQISNETSRGQLVKYTFTQDDLAASQSAAAMKVIETGASSGTLAVEGYRIPFDFEIVGISTNLSTAITGDTLTIEPTIGGTGTGQQLAMTSVAAISLGTTSKIVRETERGIAGQILGVSITSGASFTPTTADLIVDVYAILRLEGI